MQINVTDSEIPGRTVSLQTLGCKLNHAETSAIAASFARAGFHVRPFGERSDVVVINSCSVTENADRECRQLVRRVLRSNRDAFVVVTGCYAQLKPEEIASIDGVDLVVGTSEKHRLLTIEHEFVKREFPRIVVTDPDGESFGSASSSGEDGRTRAYLKIQDGCDYTCTFCTIPIARGRGRSLGLQQARDQAVRLIDQGYRELVLTGVNVGDYNPEPGVHLVHLLDVLHTLKGLARLRISSIEPNLVTDRIVRLAASSDKLMPHFHIPLQSGSDSILARMRRRYRSALFVERLEHILSAIPDAAIGVDVIVGFPGEGEAEFASTFELLHSLPIAYLHVFSYSERVNTPAAGYEGTVPVNERRRRTRLLRALSDVKKSSYALRFRTTVRPVLIEGAGFSGYTDNYLRVELEGADFAAGSIVAARLGEFNGERILGTAAESFGVR